MLVVKVLVLKRCACLNKSINPAYVICPVIQLRYGLIFEVKKNDELW